METPLERNGVVPRPQRVILRQLRAAFEGERSVSRSQRAPRQPEKPGPIRMRNSGGFEAEASFEHSALRRQVVWGAQQQHAVAVGPVTSDTVTQNLGKYLRIRDDKRAMQGRVWSLRTRPWPRIARVRRKRDQGALLDDDRVTESLDEPCSVDRLTCHIVLRRRLRIGPPARKPSNDGHPERIDLRAMREQSGVRLVRQILSQPPHRPEPDIEAEASDPA